MLSTVGNGFQTTLQSIGGIVIATFESVSYLSTKLRTLNFEKKLTKIPKFKTSYITSFVFGAAFAAAWTPCVGPILPGTVTLAATAPGQLYNSLIAYAMGLGIPFLITGAFFSQATGIIRRMVKYLKYFNPDGSAAHYTWHTSVHKSAVLVGNFPLANELINFERGI